MQTAIEVLHKDVIVIGAGGAGLAAAIVAAHRGLDVLVVEKTGFYGGATAWSGGNVWAPGNSLAVQEGLVDDREAAMAYLKAVVGEGLDNDRVEAFLDAVPAMVDFFQRHTVVRFEVQSRFSDHHPEVAGASRGGRCITPLPYEGRELGAAFRQLREPLEQVNAPFGMMIGFADIEHFQNAGKSWRSFRYVAGMVLRLLRDKIFHSRGTRLTMGNALAARLVRAAQDAGVEIWLDTPARNLLRSDGRVTGVVVQHERKQLSVAARRGVVLAAGGFSANAVMRSEYIPHADQHVSLMPDANDGGGIHLGLEAGGRMGGGNRHNGDWVVTSVMENADGTVTKCLHTVLDKPKPGCMAVNRQGRRFANEAARDMVDAMHRSGSVPAYLICDHRFIRKYGMGLVKPGGFGLKKYRDAGYLITADDIPGLAAALAIDGATLSDTIQRFNEQARQGVDRDFGRGDSEQDRASGDPRHTPNPCLGPLETPPYHAIKILPGDASTWVGLRTDSKARVLTADGSPIAGLYAAGLDAHSLWRGHSPSLGANNTLSLTLGYIAAMDLAGEGGGWPLSE